MKISASRLQHETLAGARVGSFLEVDRRSHECQEAISLDPFVKL
jgi:hypothetical protein